MKKLGWTILFLGVSCALWSLHGQTKVNLSYERIPLIEAIRTIESTTSYRFVYSKSSIAGYNLTNLSFRNADIDDVLNRIERQTPVRFLRRGTQISVRVLGKSKSYNEPNVAGLFYDPITQKELS